MTLVTERLTTLIVDHLEIIIEDYNSSTCQKAMAKFNSLVNYNK